jgi:chromosome segregation ATPase
MQNPRLATTNDLVDVRWSEKTGQELATRQSSRWEDEYSLRLSGFREAKSKAAAEMEEQQRRLNDTKEALTQRLKNFSKERQAYTKERAEIFDKNTKQTEKMNELETKVKEQQEEIATLKPAEETVSEEDGAKKPDETKPAPAAAKPAAKPAAKAAPAKPKQERAGKA